jgi:hypothetical protein
MAGRTLVAHLNRQQHGRALVTCRTTAIGHYRSRCFIVTTTRPGLTHQWPASRYP